MTTKPMPCDTECEEALLGALLVDPHAYLLVSFLTIDDFYRPKNQWVWEACTKVETIDQVTVAHKLSELGHLEGCGGAAYLSHLISQVATSVHVEHYAAILKKLGNARRLIKTGMEIEDLGFEVDEEGQTKALQKILRLSREKTRVVSPDDLSEFGLKYFSELGEGITTPIHFGLQQLDALGGMQPGEFWVLGAKTETGKTTLLNQIARYQAPKPVLFFTTEMTRAQWVSREVSRIMHVPTGCLGALKYIKDHMYEILGALEEIKKSNVHVVPGSVSCREVYLQTAAIPGVALVIIDYLQRLKDVNSDYQSTSRASREIADMAKDLEIPVLLSSQLKRPDYDREGKEVKKPLLTQLKDSGNIENDIDGAIFLERDKYADADDPRRYYAAISVEKHRQGGEHPRFPVRFIPNEQTYSEKERDGSEIRR